MLSTELQSPKTAPVAANEWFFVRPAIDSLLGMMIGVLIGNFLGWC
jgi:hypothetical protein